MCSVSCTWTCSFSHKWFFTVDLSFAFDSSILNEARNAEYESTKYVTLINHLQTDLHGSTLSFNAQTTWKACWTQPAPAYVHGEGCLPPGWCSHRSGPPSSGPTAAASAGCCSWVAPSYCLMVWWGRTLCSLYYGGHHVSFFKQSFSAISKHVRYHNSGYDHKVWRFRE